MTADDILAEAFNTRSSLDAAAKTVEEKRKETMASLTAVTDPVLAAIKPICAASEKAFSSSPDDVLHFDFVKYEDHISYLYLYVYKGSAFDKKDFKDVSNGIGGSYIAYNDQPVFKLETRSFNGGGDTSPVAVYAYDDKRYHGETMGPGMGLGTKKWNPVFTKSSLEQADTNEILTAFQQFAGRAYTAEQLAQLKSQLSLTGKTGDQPKP